jgi:hypothetical protein
MKQKKQISFCLITFLGILLLINSGCKKETEDVSIYLPTVTTNDVKSITKISAECGGNVTNDGGFIVTKRGLCWSTKNNPTVNDFHLYIGAGSGSFTSEINDLKGGTRYYLRAFAINEKGTGYGSTAIFDTDSSYTLLQQPDSVAGKDALLSNYSTDTNTNYGKSSIFSATAFTAGDFFIHRSIVDFNLTSIPKNAIIDSAFFWLYAFNDKDNISVGHYGASQGGSLNNSYLQRITSSWDEKTVTWATQPSTTAENQVLLSGTTKIDDNFEHIDVKNLINDMVKNPSSSYGFMFKLVTEEKYRKLYFCTSDHPDAARRPKLVVYYTIDY